MNYSEVAKVSVPHLQVPPFPAWRQLSAKVRNILERQLLE